MNKKTLFDKIIAQLHEAQEKAEEARDAEQAEANSHIGRMESRYDTFKEEAQYAVAAHELRMREYQSSVARVKELLADASNLLPTNEVKIGSVVTLVSDDGEEKHFIISPVGGGVVVQGVEGSFTVLTPEAPLGRKLLNLAVGNAFELNGTRFSVTSVL